MTSFTTATTSYYTVSHGHSCLTRWTIRYRLSKALSISKTTFVSTYLQMSLELFEI